MAKTAISVARNCGMVGSKDQVVIINGHPPDKDGPARLEWEKAETSQEESPEQSDYEVSRLIPELNIPVMIGSMVRSQYLKVEVYSKLLIPQSKFSGPRKFTLRYQLFETKGNEM